MKSPASGSRTTSPTTTSPSFSPSGKWIAFESDRPAAAMPPGADPLAGYASLLKFKDIYKVSLAGDSLVLVAGGPTTTRCPATAPHDSTLIFVSNRSGIDNLYLESDSAGAPARAAPSPTCSPAASPPPGPGTASCWPSPSSSRAAGTSS